MPDDQWCSVKAVRTLAYLADVDTPSAAEVEAMRSRVRRRISARMPPPSRSSRRTALATVVALVLLAGGGAVAVAGVTDDDTAPAPEEVTSFAADAGISPSEARGKLDEQDRIPALAAAEHADLGDAFGGIWVGAKDQRIKLALTAGADARTVMRAQQAIGALGLQGTVDLVRTPHSERSLVALQNRIQGELDAVNRGATSPVEVETDIRRGRVVVRRPVPASAATPRQRRFLAEIERRDAVDLRPGAGPLRVGVGTGEF